MGWQLTQLNRYKCKCLNNYNFLYIIINYNTLYLTPDSTNKVQYFRIYKYLVSTVPGSHDEISAPDWFVLSRNVSEKHWLNYQLLIITNIETI